MPDKNKYDVIIIGSGLGGLICGAILSKNGKKVCVLEKHDQIGGNMQVFKRKGCSFSPGMHYGGSLDKGQVVYKVFNYLGIYNSVKISKLDENCFEKIILGDKEYCYAMGMENFKANLINYFPDEAAAIEKYCKKIEDIWEMSDLLNLREIGFSKIHIFDDYNESAYGYIDSITGNEELKAVLAATNGLYNGNKEKTPLFIHANINNSFIKSAWRIAESGEGISTLLKQVIEENSGTVLTKQEVTKLKFNDRNVCSAETKEGLYYADNFISNLHPAPTYKLLEENKLRKVYINRINDLENSISVFMLFIVLNKKKVKNINSNIYYSRDQNVWDNYDYTSEDWPKGYMMYTTQDKKNPGFAEGLVAMSMMRFDEVKQWENTEIMKRGSEYLDFKKEKEKKLLSVIGLKFPEIVAEIDSVYSSSPLTFRDYTGTPEGSMYGIIKDYKKPLESYIAPKTRIPNLLLTGQNIGTHGLLGVTLSSFLTCSTLINMDKVLKEINTY